MRENSIIIKDPLYKQILVPIKFKELLDMPEFQRLRYIRQTSFTYSVYPCATHNRFSHSIGTFHLMNKVLNNGLTNIDETTKENLLIAALYHDIGHGPFSHLWEFIFPHFDHEQASYEILKSKGYEKAAKLLKETTSYSKLISSSLDVDKLDYMARDSFFTGVSYGLLESDFILEHCYVKNNKLIILPSALSSVEDLITQRINLYKTVYFHKVSLKYDFIFIKIFQRVNELLKQEKLEITYQPLLNFFKKQNTIQDLLELTDDIILYHIKIWSKNKDPILSDFCNMFLKRDKLKAINLSHVNIEKDNIKKIIEKNGYDINYYFGETKTPIKIIQSNIYVDYNDEIKSIFDVSPLLSFYKNEELNVECVFFPKELEKQILNQK